MTKPRTREEIAEEWFKIHDGMCVRSIDGQPYREHFLAALREAADAARREEREAVGPVVGALRDLLKDVDARFLLDSGFKGMGHNIAIESAGRLRVDSEYAKKRLAEWDARSRPEEPRPGGLNSPTG